MFPGFDVNRWDDHIFWMWRYSNLRFLGYYLSRGLDYGAAHDWQKRWHDLQDMGWGLWPLWVPYNEHDGHQMATADGGDHGRLAAELARWARIERGATIYLDIEPTLFGVKRPEELARRPGIERYVRSWCREVIAHGYYPGVYCKRQDANAILGPKFRTEGISAFPVAVPGKRCRAGWDRRNFRLPKLPPSRWGIGLEDTWTSQADMIGCQFDWYRAGREFEDADWPGPDGRPDGSRDFDWDMCRVSDPSHPRAAVSVVGARDRDPTSPGNYTDSLHLFVIRINTIMHGQRANDGKVAWTTVFSPSDIGPELAPEEDGFDPVIGAAVSRQPGHMDLFALSQDGRLRTAWLNPQEQFPGHSWTVSGSRRCRRGAPIGAVSRELNQLDVFTVSEDHRLLTQWWHYPSATDWQKNHRVLDGPMVAGGSNIAAIGTPGDAMTPSALDVFYISADYTLSVSHPDWGRGFHVIHAAWSEKRDWVLNRINGLQNVAAASGVTVLRDHERTIHLVVQGRNRAELIHATRRPGAAWIIRPGPLYPFSELQPDWWMSFELLELPQNSGVLLVGLTCLRRLAWATFRNDRWTRAQAVRATFDASRRLVCAIRGQNNLDIFGVNEQGEFQYRTITF